MVGNVGHEVCVVFQFFQLLSVNPSFVDISKLKGLHKVDVLKLIFLLYESAHLFKILSGVLFFKRSDLPIRLECGNFNGSSNTQGLLLLLPRVFVVIVSPGRYILGAAGHPFQCYINPFMC